MTFFGYGAFRFVKVLLKQFLLDPKLMAFSSAATVPIVICHNTVYSGARDAAVRRRVLVREEERGRQEARAFHHAYVRGRGMHHKGQLTH